MCEILIFKTPLHNNKFLLLFLSRLLCSGAVEGMVFLPVDSGDKVRKDSLPWTLCSLVKNQTSISHKPVATAHSLPGLGLLDLVCYFLLLASPMRRSLRDGQLLVATGYLRPDFQEYVPGN